MEQNAYEYMYEEKKDSVLKGLIGALLGALLGAVVWAVIGGLLEMFIWPVGLLIGFLAMKGYDLLKGRQGVAKLICVIIAIIIGVVLGTLASYVWVFHGVYAAETAGMSEQVLKLRGYYTEAEYMRLVFADSEVIGEMTGNLIKALGFALLWCIGLLRGIAAKPAPDSAEISAAQVPGTQTQSEDNNQSAAM